jgi:hypothetical protein
LINKNRNLFTFSPKRLIELSLVITFLEDSILFDGIKSFSVFDDFLFIIFIIYNLKYSKFKMMDLGLLIIFSCSFLFSALINNSSILHSIVFIRQFIPLLYYLFVFKISNPIDKTSIIKMLKFFIILQTSFNLIHVLRIGAGVTSLSLDSFTGSFQNSNIAGVVSTLLLISVFILENKRSKLLLSFGLINILISYSRNGYVCLIIILFFLYFNREKYGIKISQRIWVGAIAGLLFVYVFIATVLFDPIKDLRSGIQTHFFHTEETYSNMLGEDGKVYKDLTRVAMYMQAFNLLQKGNILVGSGPSSFATGGAYRLSGKLYKSTLKSQGTVSAGSWLGVMVELGLFSFCIIFFMLTKKLLYLSKKSKNKLNKLAENRTPLLQIICLIIIIISSLFLNNFEERALTYWLFYFSYA